MTIKEWIEDKKANFALVVAFRELQAARKSGDPELIAAAQKAVAILKTRQRIESWPKLEQKLRRQRGGENENRGGLPRNSRRPPPLSF